MVWTIRESVVCARVYVCAGACCGRGLGGQVSYRRYKEDVLESTYSHAGMAGNVEPLVRSTGPEYTP